MFVLALKKARLFKITSLSDSHHPIEKFPQANFPPPLPLKLFPIWKSLDKGSSFLKTVSLFQVKSNFSIENIFFRVIMTSKMY